MAEMRTEKFSFPSSDGIHQCGATVYAVPDVPVKAVIQICHGMVEDLNRYRLMAEHYTANGFVVAGNDHLGHGDTVNSPEERGNYGAKDGAQNLVDDIHSMNVLLHNRYPGVPIILYGHSMGSFYARWYAEKWPESIKAAVFSGTAGPHPRNIFGKVAAGAIAAVKGRDYVSHFVVKASGGSNNARIADPENRCAWLSRDKTVTEYYSKEPRYQFHFTASSYREMISVLCHVSKKQWARNIDKNLPILLVAGTEDPVGDYGAGVRAVWAMLGDAGVKDLTCQIWEGGRHEMHNETNREEVYEYVQAWIEDRI